MAISHTGKAKHNAEAEMKLALAIILSVTLGVFLGSYKYSDTKEECTQKFRVCEQIWVGSSK
jgi:hypothetical protein